MNDCENYDDNKCANCPEYGGDKRVGCYDPTEATKPGPLGSAVLPGCKVYLPTGYMTDEDLAQHLDLHIDVIRGALDKLEAKGLVRRVEE